MICVPLVHLLVMVWLTQYFMYLKFFFDSRNRPRLWLIFVLLPIIHRIDSQTKQEQIETDSLDSGCNYSSKSK